MRNELSNSWNMLKVETCLLRINLLTDNCLCIRQIQMKAKNWLIIYYVLRRSTCTGLICHPVLVFVNGFDIRLQKHTAATYISQVLIWVEDDIICQRCLGVISYSRQKRKQASVFAGSDPLICAMRICKSAWLDKCVCRNIYVHSIIGDQICIRFKSAGSASLYFQSQDLTNSLAKHVVWSTRPIHSALSFSNKEWLRPQNLEIRVKMLIQSDTWNCRVRVSTWHTSTLLQKVWMAKKNMIFHYKEPFVQWNRVGSIGVKGSSWNQQYQK